MKLKTDHFGRKWPDMDDFFIELTGCLSLKVAGIFNGISPFSKEVISGTDNYQNRQVLMTVIFSRPGKGFTRERFRSFAS